MALKDVRILIVDDEAFYRDSLRDILSRIGFTVVAEAADGIEAVRMFLTHRPHIVIMDVYMPVKNGIDATREMIALNKNANVLTSSASDCPSDTNAVMKVGAKGILKKPFEPREIYDTIKQVLCGA
ncbi:response regulator [Geomonas sp. Red69]|uniref:Response regulator n=1 Tax=Geomonas diazotrophica TaxID=2843197 RepID=A0ABX8JIT9_9BACT|nr:MULTISPECIES: response regulator [Geomonas]MBU5635522.1 response regulator [Geomonas diazotrophica]QWV97427.1 response regulator [Geomonas nitrogeniifigens]QXE86585.1 response regulator [Geomonas nitrogeniifigens]